MEKKKNKVEELPIEEFDNDKQDIKEKFIKKFRNKKK
jgi:hypothetical protein